MTTCSTEEGERYVIGSLLSGGESAKRIVAPVLEDYHFDVPLYAGMYRILRETPPLDAVFARRVYLERMTIWYEASRIFPASIRAAEMVANLSDYWLVSDAAIERFARRIRDAAERRDDARQDAYEYLLSHGVSTFGDVAQAMEAAGFARAEATDALRRLRDAGAVTMRADGRRSYWRLPERDEVTA